MGAVAVPPLSRVRGRLFQLPSRPFSVGVSVTVERRRLLGLPLSGLVSLCRSSVFARLASI
jgi:hypothetical protein